MYNRWTKYAAKNKATIEDLGDGWTYKCSTPEDYAIVKRIKNKE